MHKQAGRLSAGRVSLIATTQRVVLQQETAFCKGILHGELHCITSHQLQYCSCKPTVVLPGSAAGAKADVHSVCPGKDLITEGLAKPRSKAKPTFTQAGANRHPHSHPGHSVAQSLSPIPTQAPASSSPAGDTNSAYNADEERRASGRAASTSGAAEGRPAPSASSRSPTKGKGSPPNSPFASITMGETRSSSALRSQGVPATDRTTQHGNHRSLDRHAPLPSEGSAVQQGRTGLKTDSPPVQAVKTVAVAAGRTAHAGSATQQEQAVGVKVDVPQQCQVQQPASTLTADSHQCQSDRKGALLRVVAPTTSHGVSRSITANPVAVLVKAEDMPAASSAFDLGVSADDPPSWRGKRKHKRKPANKPGPSAFPQLPHERALQLQSSITAITTPSSSHSQRESRTPAADMPAHTPAQTDQMADAMQQRLWRLQMDELRADSDRHTAQQHLSLHGGYMQKGGQERRPRRRTTRSRLRAADVQDGEKLFTHAFL